MEGILILKDEKNEVIGHFETPRDDFEGINNDISEVRRVWFENENVRVCLYDFLCEYLPEMEIYPTTITEIYL